MGGVRLWQNRGSLCKNSLRPETSGTAPQPRAKTRVSQSRGGTDPNGTSALNGKGGGTGMGGKFLLEGSGHVEKKKRNNTVLP